MKYLFLGILKVLKVPCYSDLSLNMCNKRWTRSYESLMMQGAFTTAFIALQGITHTSSGHIGGSSFSSSYVWRNV